MASAPTGTLIQKIHCQARPSVTAPPIIGPPSTARPVRPLKMPIAQPRRSGGKAAPSRPIASGITTAAPTPWKVRAAISHGTEVRQRAGDRGDGEEGEAGRERPPPAPPVTDRRRGHQQHREAEAVGVHRPFQLLDRGAEVLPDGGQRRRDHQDVERHHHRADRGQAQHPALLDGRPFLAAHEGPPDSSLSLVLTAAEGRTHRGDEFPGFARSEVVTAT